METPARFVQTAGELGLNFTYTNGEEAGHYTIVESLGGGAALLDFDGDALLDILIPGGGRIAKGPQLIGSLPGLFRKTGAGRYENVTAAAGVEFAPYYSHGAAVADYDHDGFPDVLITGYGGLVLFRNLGDGTFEEQAKAAGLTDGLWSSTAAWGDLNGDNQLDLYIAHYVDWSWENHPVCKGPDGQQRDVCPPRSFHDLPDAVYYSNGDGTFHDATKHAGLASDGRGLGVVIGDVDLDGKQDVYVGNDEVPNFLYHNLGSGQFAEIGRISGTSVGFVGTPDGSMGVDIGDYNLDGLPDLFVANYEREAFALYRNEGDTNFTHVSQGTGITALGGLYVGWGSVFFDFDHDGDEDLFITNGHVIRYPVNAPLMQKPILLENQDGKRFVNIASKAGEYFHQTYMGRGAAVGDLDDDGDLDLVVVATNQPAALLMNETETGNGWLSLRLVGTKSSRDPIGAVLFLETTTGRQMRQLKGGGSYASTNDSRIHFGVGESSIQRLEIRWPSGTTETVEGIAPNQLHTMIEPK